jgi:hypothetical protein
MWLQWCNLIQRNEAGSSSLKHDVSDAQSHLLVCGAGWLAAMKCMWPIILNATQTLWLQLVDRGKLQPCPVDPEGCGQKEYTLDEFNLLESTFQKLLSQLSKPASVSTPSKPKVQLSTNHQVVPTIKSSIAMCR